MADQMNLKKSASDAFFKQITGPMGGIFALGVFCGMFGMHVYMSEFVYKQRINALQARVESLETEKKAQADKTEKLQTQLNDIAIRKLKE